MQAKAAFFLVPFPPHDRVSGPRLPNSRVPRRLCWDEVRDAGAGLAVKALPQICGRYCWGCWARGVACGALPAATLVRDAQPPAVPVAAMLPGTGSEILVGLASPQCSLHGKFQ